MMTPPTPSTAELHPDEINRLWQHGMHEERLFYDRLDYFSAMQVGLLGVFAILTNKDFAQQLPKTRPLSTRESSDLPRSLHGQPRLW